MSPNFHLVVSSTVALALSVRTFHAARACQATTPTTATVFPPIVTTEIYNNITAVMEPPADEAPPGSPVIETALALPDCCEASASPTPLPRTIARGTAAVMEPVTEESPPAVSAIERLPTEIVQHVAAYLICTEHSMNLAYCSENCTIDTSDGVCELRATSRTLRAKTGHVFAQCFQVKDVTFHLYTLKKLVQLSQCSAYAPLVQSLVFIGEMPSWTGMFLRKKEAGLTGSDEEKVMEDAAVKDLSGKYAPELALVTVALRGFRNLRTVTIGRLLMSRYSAKVRSRSLAQHPPSIILAATMMGGVALENIHMAAGMTGRFHGVKPRILDGFVHGSKRFENLKLLYLVLTSRNSMFQNYDVGLQYS
jgi:hypothetical protein